ncbi:MAG: 1-phosphofructokinase family hexose kinase [Clostridia bacterium]|nr:1-phosphofructokinase family hexose kinase [Clostridia bacterium]
MITAVSLNPSIDRTLTVEGFTAGGLNRILSRSDTPAGKGINVALTVSGLGLDAECVGFMYRDSAPLFEKRLMLNSTAYDFIWCDGAARTNIKVFDRAAGVVTELNESGRQIEEEKLADMVELVVRHAENSDFLVLSGSVPPGCPQDFYQTLIGAVDGLGCRCVLDADGERLKLGLEARPYMIKPNRSELEMMTGEKLSAIADVKRAALRCVDRGVQIVAVSLGDEGALITDGDDTLFAPRMNIEVKGTVGAGDAMVAGLTAGFMADSGLEEAFRMGVACASARCMTEGYKAVDRTIYKAFLDMVRIERI